MTLLERLEAKIAEQEAQRRADAEKFEKKEKESLERERALEARLRASLMQSSSIRSLPPASEGGLSVNALRIQKEFQDKLNEEKRKNAEAASAVAAALQQLEEEKARADDERRRGDEVSEALRLANIEKERALQMSILDAPAQHLHSAQSQESWPSALDREATLAV